VKDHRRDLDDDERALGLKRPHHFGKGPLGDHNIRASENGYAIRVLGEDLRLEARGRKWFAEYAQGATVQPMRSVPMIVSEAL
jgi:hypothetical protein